MIAVFYLPAKFVFIFNQNINNRDVSNLNHSLFTSLTIYKYVTIIYFAVDLDVTSDEIESYILPYFKVISTKMDPDYYIGIYGTRNVCSQICHAGYAKTCFVSDMSTGYSGNMGFKIPENRNLMH